MNNPKLPAYADTSKYHPYDVLILKHFPHENITALRREGRHENIYRRAVELEAIKSPPPQIPWPLPPIRPLEELEPSIEAWRQKALAAIDSRLEAYSNGVYATSSVVHDASDMSITSRTAPAHRALFVPELLEQIMRNTSISTQLVAWNVCHRWRDMVDHILGFKDRSYTTPPVDHAVFMEQSKTESCVQPTEGELSDLEHDVLSMVQDDYVPESRPFFPARLTQCSTLSQQVYDNIRHLYGLHNYHIQAFPAYSNRSQWLDMSQLQFNHCFSDLLSGRVQYQLGRCEIALQPGPREGQLLQHRYSANAYAQKIAPMYLTNPPCKAVSVYVQSGTGWFPRLTKIVDTDGVKIGHFVDSLQSHAAEACAQWRREVEKMRRTIATQDWTEYTDRFWRHMAWHCYAVPNLVIFLQHSEDDNKTLAEDAYLKGGIDTDISERQWLGNIDSV